MSPKQKKIARTTELKNSTWLFLAQSTRMVGSTAGIMLVARYLGPSQYGMLSIALSINAIFLPLVNLGLQRVILKELSIQIISEKIIIKSAVIMQIFGSIFAAILSYTTCVILNFSDQIIIMCVILSISYFFLSSDIISQFFLYRQKSYKTMMGIILGTIFSFTFRLIATNLSFTLVFFSAANIVQNATNLLVNIFQYRKMKFEKNKNNEVTRSRKSIYILLLRQSYPIFIASFFTAASVNLDRIILEKHFNLQDIGIYAVLLQVLMLPKTAIAAYIAGLSPQMIAGYSNGLDAFANRVTQGLSEAFLLALSTLIVLVAFGNYVINFIAGPEYEYSPTTFSLLCLGLLVSTPSAMRAEFLLLQGKQKISLFIGMGEAIVLSLAFALLIPLYGISGAAGAYLINSVFSAIFLNLAIRPLRPYAKIYFSAVLRALTLNPIREIIKSLK